METGLMYFICFFYIIHSTLLSLLNKEKSNTDFNDKTERSWRFQYLTKTRIFLQP